MGDGIDKSSMYSGSEEGEGMLNGRKLTDPLVLVLLVAAALWLIFRGTQEIAEIGKTDTLFMALITFMLLAKGGDFALRHYTPKLVCDPIHTTTRGWGDKIGIYEVFTIGDIDAGGMHYRGRQGTIIVPQEAVNRLSRNVALMTAVFRIDEMEIPTSIRHEVLARSYFKPPYYRGYVGDIILERVPMVFKLIDEVNSANAVANMRKDFIDNRMSEYERWDDYASRKMLKKKSAAAKTKEFLTGNDEGGD